MGATTFLLIPVLKGDISLTPDFPGGVRKLAANAVPRYFNKTYVTDISPITAAIPVAAGVNSSFRYADPSAFTYKIYESTLTAAQIFALDV